MSETLHDQIETTAELIRHCKQCMDTAHKASQMLHHVGDELNAIVDTAFGIGAAVAYWHTTEHLAKVQSEETQDGQDDDDEEYKLVLSTVDGVPMALPTCVDCENVILDTQGNRTATLSEIACEHTNRSSLHAYLGYPL